jgi:transcriptional regulator with XRE-family HTH domain
LYYNSQISQNQYEMRDLRKNSKTHKEGDEEMGNISENCKCPKLFEELDRQGMKQNEFAKRIGASTGNVSDWASGKSSPTRRRWMTIAEVLGKPVDELMGTKKEPAGMGGLKWEWADVEAAYKNATPEARAAAKAAALAVLENGKAKEE